MPPPLPPSPLARQLGEYRIAVTGDRDWKDARVVHRELAAAVERARQAAPDRRVTLITGGSLGAEALTEAWAKANGVALQKVMPDWKQGKGAGYTRDRRVVELSHELLVFWCGASRASAQTIDLARRAQRPVRIVEPEVRGAPDDEPQARGKTSDLARVLDLPRVDVADVPDLTARFMRPGVRREDLQPGPLLPIQSQALHWAHTAGGLVGALGVGAGKTLATFLLPGQLASRVAVLFMPPHLYRKTLGAYADMRPFWQLPELGDWRQAGKLDGLPLGDRPLLYIVSLGQLSTTTNTDLLERIKPDLVIVDEAHLLRGAHSARSRRFRRYFSDHPKTRACFLSGTITNSKISDYWHLCKWALGDASPLPLNQHVAEAWDAAFGALQDDERLARDSARGATGPAQGYVTDIRNRFLTWARAYGVGTNDHLRAYQARLRSVAGFVATSASSLDVPLTIVKRSLTPPPGLQIELANLVDTWRTPAGDELDCSLAYGEVMRTLSVGFYNEAIWPNGPDLQWITARRRWHRGVRTFLRKNLPGVDSPFLVAQACHKEDPRTLRHTVDLGADESATLSRLWKDWQAVADRPEPDVQAVWVDDWLCRDVLKLAEKVGPCIIWYESPAVGRRLAELSGLPLFGAGDSDGKRLIALAKNVLEKKSPPQTIIASWLCHGTGKDLQGWATAIIAQLPANGSAWEQLLGRLHRQGQLADVVTYWIYLTTAWAEQALQKSLAECQYQQRSIGSAQKLVLADIVSEEDML